MHRPLFRVSPFGKRGVMLAVVLVIVVVATGAVVVRGAVLGLDDATIILSVGYVVALGSLLLGLVRGGLRSYAFWFTFVAAYPAFTPLVVQDLLGIPDISARQPDLLQRTSDLAVPVLVAATAAFVLSLAIRATAASPSEGRSHPELMRPSAVLLVLLTSAFVLASAWLTEPGLPLGIVHSYTAVLDSRIPGTNFAGGAWVVFACLGLLIVQVPNVAMRRARVARVVFYSALVLSIAWLLLHARRSEVAGLLPFLLFTFRGRIRIRQVVLVLIPLITALAVLGYVRQPGARPTENAVRYVQLPGAPGNILVTWVGAFKMHVEGLKPFAPGTTYVGLIQNMPPRLLHLPRAPELKDYVASVFTSLKNAGQFYLGEPFANFGYVGVLVFVLLLGAATSAAVAAVHRFQTGSVVNLLVALVASDYLVLVFRTLWYGLDALISGTIMAVLVGVAVTLYFKFFASWTYARDGTRSARLTELPVHQLATGQRVHGPVSGPASPAER